MLAGSHGDLQGVHRGAAQLLQGNLQHVVVPDAHPSGGDDGVAPRRGCPQAIRQDVLVVLPGAEIDPAESVGSELGQQCRAVGVADLPRRQGSIGSCELVAGGQDADRRARVDEQRLDAEAREYPDVGGCEPRPWREDLGTGGDVFAGFPYVRARAHRFLDEHGQRAVLRPRALHHAHCVGTGRHQRTGHYPHCLAVRKGGLRPVAGRHGPGHPQADRGGSHVSGLYGISVHCGIGEAGHGLGGVHRLGQDVPKRVADGDAAWCERRDRGQDETTRLGYRDQCRHP